MLRLVNGQLYRLPSAVGARLALAHHHSKTGAVGTDIIERGTDSHEGAKQTGSEQPRPCVAQALARIDRRVEDVERRQHVVALKACAA